MNFTSSSSAETKKFAASLAKKILRSKHPQRHALVLALTGELGSGKTTFVKGFCRGLGLKNKVVSPTFILMRRGALKHKRFKNVFHVDAYRIKNTKELKPLRFKEVLDNPENIVLIEWADIIKKALPRNASWLRFSHGKKEKERAIKTH